MIFSDMHNQVTMNEWYQSNYWKAKNPENGRLYSVLIENDLFNGWHVYRQWWSIRRKAAGKKHHFFESYEEANKLFQSLIHRKTKRGYKDKMANIS